MAYDEELAGRMRELLVTEDVVEKRMFGGLAFLVRGNMSVSASRRGGLLVRIDPDESEEALARPHVEPMAMGGRSRRGWVYVAPEALEAAGALEEWVERGVSYASSLPPK